MRTRLLPVALVVVLALGLGASALRGRAADTVAASYLIKTFGPTSSLTLSGQLECEAQINQPVGNFTAIPQYSADGTTWMTATPIYNGLIGQSGVFIGTNPTGGAAPAFFRLLFSSVSAPQISGQIVCGDSLPPANSGATGNVSSVNGGACISATPTVGDVVVSVQGAGCTPMPLNASAPIVADTSTPGVLNISCPTCSTASSGVELQAPGTPTPQTGSAGVTDRLAAGTLHGGSLGTSPCLGSNAGDIVANTSITGAGCAVKGNAKSWPQVACGEPSATHCYPMNDAAGCTQITDQVGNFPPGTAAPSPVPIATASPFPPVCGEAPINGNGDVSMLNIGGCNTIPVPALPASPNPYSIEIVSEMLPLGVGSISTYNYQGMWTIKESGGNQENFSRNSDTTANIMQAKLSNNYPLGGVTTQIYTYMGPTITDDVFTTDGATHARVYLNGALAVENKNAPAWTDGTSPGCLGWANDNADPTGGGLYGRIGGFAIYNAELTPAQIQAHVAALGI